MGHFYSKYRVVIIGVLLSSLVAGVLWRARLSVIEIVMRKSVAHARKNIHMAALRSYVNLHHELPPPLNTVRSRSEFLAYAGYPYDEREMKSIDPEYVLPLYDANGEWFCTASDEGLMDSPVFVRIASGVPGNSFILAKPTGPVLWSDGFETPISLGGQAVILYSYEERNIPVELSPSEVSRYLYAIRGMGDLR